jgi:DNA-binding GntR family transcriptional regulator
MLYAACNMPTIGASVLGPIARTKLVDVATSSLREAILNGQMVPGERLRESDLARQLAISRTPLREALMKLEQEGLIERLPSGAPRVRLLDVEEAIQLYEVREVLDGLAARLAAAHIAPADVAKLRGLLADMQHYTIPGQAHAWFAAHVAFHGLIFVASANPPLRQLASVVRLSIQRLHPLLLATTSERRAEAHREHTRVFEAIAHGEGELAERCARSHIAAARGAARGAVSTGRRRDVGEAIDTASG